MDFEKILELEELKEGQRIEIRYVFPEHISTHVEVPTHVEALELKPAEMIVYFVGLNRFGSRQGEFSGLFYSSTKIDGELIKEGFSDTDKRPVYRSLLVDWIHEITLLKRV